MNNAITKRMEKKESPYTVGRNVSWNKHYREQYGSSSKN